jgi:hypothetical protein
LKWSRSKSDRRSIPADNPRQVSDFYLYLNAFDFDLLANIGLSERKIRRDLLNVEQLRQFKCKQHLNFNQLKISSPLVYTEVRNRFIPNM